jgi:hypothetical protein
MSISKLDAYTDQCAHMGIILRPADSQETLSDAPGRTPRHTLVGARPRRRSSSCARCSGNP